MRNWGPCGHIGPLSPPSLLWEELGSQGFSHAHFLTLRGRAAGGAGQLLLVWRSARCLPSLALLGRVEVPEPSALRGHPGQGAGASPPPPDPGLSAAAAAWAWGREPPTAS